ncbi:hypothetical protein D3C80_776120 [compost metagenome]
MRGRPLQPFQGTAQAHLLLIQARLFSQAQWQAGLGLIELGMFRQAGLALDLPGDAFGQLGEVPEQQRNTR